MRLYIVRHGESEGNVNHRFQTEDELLTAKGQKQAKLLAQRFKHVHIDRLIVSSLKRTQQTAHEIAQVTSAPIQLTDDFVEYRRPSEIVGKSHGDAYARSIESQIDEHRDDPDYHFSDEENAFDFIARLDRGLQKIIKEAGDSETVVLVAHGYVIRVLIGLILFGTDFSPLSFEMMKGRVQTNNTGISVVDYSPESGYSLVTFNDHSHLLDA